MAKIMVPFDVSLLIIVSSVCNDVKRTGSK